MPAPDILANDLTDAFQSLTNAGFLRRNSHAHFPFVSRAAWS